MGTELTLDFIVKLPKTDLHVHLDGSLRLDTIIELARKHKIKLPTFDRDDLFRLIYAGEVCQSLDDYLKAFDITLSVMQTEESLERAAFELAEDAWREVVRHIEVRYSPMLHTREGLRLAIVVEAVLRGLRMAKRTYGIRYGLILCGIRSMSAPTGCFEIGGPHGDAGLTGRKIIVDTYGGAAPHGGGAFSGKDPSKVDRSAAYAARYVAKNIVAAGLATKCLVQVSYAIGVAQPTSIMVETYGTGTVSDEKLTDLVRKHFDLRPKGIVQMLDLLRPVYRRTAAYGHFGREEPGFTWEKTDKAAALKADAK